MQGLDRIILINAAGFDYVDFPVGGHGQVIGVNGHGKSTLLRTVLFFYLGTNDKAPYALHETKADFVSHYLGEPPSYLIYEVARGNGQPHYHIAVTRPAGRVQFHFVDAPYRRDYYVDGRLVRSVEAVMERLREAKCAFDTLDSYEKFNHRIYGVVSSPYAVFRPAAKTSGQVGVLPRIISGIFTVSQLDADKLKTALTCGVRRDSLVTELDLVQLKGQLENFRRVNQAVKTYLRNENDAVSLVELATDFDRAKQERMQAVEEMVRMAKLLPKERDRLIEQTEVLNREQNAAKAEFETENSHLVEAIGRLDKDIAVLDGNISKAKDISAKYVQLEIARKSADLERLPALEEQKQLAEREYLSLTAKFDDESQRKEQLLTNVRQSWAEQKNHFQQRQLDIGNQCSQSLSVLDEEIAESRSRLERERVESIDPLVTRRQRLASSRDTLNQDFKALGGMKPPAEIAEIERTLKNTEQKQGDESSRQERLRSEISLANEKFTAERATLERDAKDEREKLQSEMSDLEDDRQSVEAELAAFDDSLARFFQSNASNAWANAAKTLNRKTLFLSAGEIEAKVSPLATSSVWGVEFSAAKLPEPEEGFDGDQLAAKLREVQKMLRDQKDAAIAARERFSSALDALDKRSAQTIDDLGAKVATCQELCDKFRDDTVRLKNKIVTLQTQFENEKTQRHKYLDERDADWQKLDMLLREDERTHSEQYQTRLKELESGFITRKRQFNKEAEDLRSSVQNEENQAQQQRDKEIARIEREFQQTIAERGVDPSLIKAAEKRASDMKNEIQCIAKCRDEVAEYRQKKIEWIDLLPTWEDQIKFANDSLKIKKDEQQRLSTRHQESMSRLDKRRNNLKDIESALGKDIHCR